MGKQVVHGNPSNVRLSYALAQVTLTFAPPYLRPIRLNQGRYVRLNPLADSIRHGSLVANAQRLKRQQDGKATSVGEVECARLAHHHK